jgi:hypothetical protein
VYSAAQHAFSVSARRRSVIFCAFRDLVHADQCNMFDKIRRFMGGGRKKKNDTPFKRSESFRRISIKRHYLERGHSKVPKPSTSGAVASKAPLPPDDELVIDYGQWLLKSDEKKPVPPSSPSSKVQIIPLEGSPGVTSAHRHRIHVSARPSPATSLDSDLPLTPRDVSLGHIWMDHSPVSRTPRSLELPPVSARRLDMPGCSGVESSRAHRSLEGGLKAARREEAPPPPAPLKPAGGGGSTKTVSSESKDSGFSFSIPRLNPTGGFFRRKGPKPRLSVSRDGYFKRTSEARKSQEAKRSRGRVAGKRLAAAAANNKGTLDLYQVLRPRSLKHLKLEPMFFVPPEKRKQQNGPRYAVGEIRDPDSVTYAGNESRKGVVDDETTYERVGGECTSDEEEENRCYVPLGVSPVPKRRPVVRRKKSAVRLKYVARPHVARRAPSTLRRRKSTKKSESLFCFLSARVDCVIGQIVPLIENARSAGFLLAALPAVQPDPDGNAAPAALINGPRGH